jgi:hypothetical protein
VSCKITINGADATPTFSFDGTGVQAGADPVQITVSALDDVAPRQRVVYVDGADTGWICYGNNLLLPQQHDIDNINAIFQTADNVLTARVDPEVCPALAAHTGTYGSITIKPDGDVYGVPDPLALGLNPLYDCAPYGDF